MTEKQESIINAALELFAEEGYRSTSTSKVAKQAGVSEGLIFRHFENKEGLLEAIIRLGEERAKILFSDIVLESDPKVLIKKYLELFQKVSQDKEAISFWKLQFKIKWEMERYGEQKMEAIRQALIQAFVKLKYNEPEKEANLLVTMMDGLATRFILQSEFDMGGTIEFLKMKYRV